VSVEKPTALDVDITIPLGSGRDRFSVRARFTLSKGILVIFGASATGKSLTVRAVAGLVPAMGRIRVGGEILLDAEAQVNVAPERRRVGYVPQHAALFPHLSVRDNVEECGRGEHVRFVVDIEKTRQRLARKRIA